MDKIPLRSTRKVVNSDGVVVSSYNYDAFGNLMTSTVSEEIAYQYTGQEFDDETGLHNFRARLYDSDLMRFYAVDPQWQTASPYIFCGNSPLMYVDTDGEWFLQALYIGYQIYKTYTLVETAYNVIDAIASGNYDVAAGSVIGFGNAQIMGCISFGTFASGFDYNPILSTLSGAVSGAASGALSAAVSGEDIGKGAISGAVVGAALGLATSQHFINMMEGEGFNSDKTVYNNYRGMGNDGFEEWTRHLSRKYNQQIIAGDDFLYDHATDITTLNRNQENFSLQMGGLDHEFGHGEQEWRKGIDAMAKREMGATNSVLENQGRYYGLDRKLISKSQNTYQGMHNIKFKTNGTDFIQTQRFPDLTYKARWYHYVPQRSNMVRFLKWGYSNVWQ